jgi:hypothetical protein
MDSVRSKQRVADHGEVLTPFWLVETMLNLVKDETERIDSRFLEPACGSGNFLVQILQLKLAAVELKYSRSHFERRHYSLLALMCIYGVELLADNIVECRADLLEIIAEYLGLTESDELYRAASYVLSQNLVRGDALTMRTNEGQPIIAQGPRQHPHRPPATPSRPQSDGPSVDWGLGRDGKSDRLAGRQRIPTDSASPVSRRARG